MRLQLLDVDLAVIISLVLDHKCYFSVWGWISLKTSTPVQCLCDCFPKEAMLLSVLHVENIPSDTEDLADLQEEPPATAWTLLNVQEAAARPVACQSVVLLFCSPRTHFK